MNVAGHEVSYEEQLRMAQNFIQQNDHFIVVSHHQPDGDAISSTLAIGWILEKLGKNFTLYNDDVVPPKFAYLWNSDRIIHPTATAMTSAQYSYVIAVDCADNSRFGEAKGLFSPDAQLLNIDHHSTNDFFGQVHVIRPKASATVEIIYDLIHLMGLSWDEAVASCIYTGLVTDTGGFRYANTTANVLNIASEMMSHGVKGSQLSTHLLEKMTYPQFCLLQTALATMSFAYDRKVAWMTLSETDFKETGSTHGETEGIVNYAQNIEGVEVGILFKEVDAKEVRVSFRSSGHVDVAQVAAQFGGGGHMRAAGCTMQCTMTEAVDQVLQSLGSKLNEL